MSTTWRYKIWLKKLIFYDLMIFKIIHDILNAYNLNLLVNAHSFSYQSEILF